MTPFLQRPRLGFTLVMLVGCWLLGTPAVAAEKLSVRKVASGVYAVIGSKGNANSGFILTRQGVVVIDSQINPRAATAMLNAIRKLTKRPILYLINTHAHPDHTAANHLFQPTKGIVAHARTKAIMASRGSAMLKTYTKFAGKGAAKGATVTLPTLTFNDQIILPIRDRNIVIRYLGIGHTVGDAIVWLPDDQVVFTGDLVYVKRLPWLGEGSTREWLKALARLKELPYKRVVPGHGPVTNRNGVKRFERYLSTLRRAVIEAFLRGDSLERIQHRITLPAYKKDLKYKEWLPLNIGHIYRSMEKER